MEGWLFGRSDVAMDFDLDVDMGLDVGLGPGRAEHSFLIGRGRGHGCGTHARTCAYMICMYVRTYGCLYHC